MSWQPIPAWASPLVRDAVEAELRSFPTNRRNDLRQLCRKVNALAYDAGWITGVAEGYSDQAADTKDDREVQQEKDEQLAAAVRRLLIEWADLHSNSYDLDPVRMESVHDAICQLRAAVTA